MVRKVDYTLLFVGIIILVLFALISSNTGREGFTDDPALMKEIADVTQAIASIDSDPKINQLPEPFKSQIKRDTKELGQKKLNELTNKRDSARAAAAAAAPPAAAAAAPPADAAAAPPAGAELTGLERVKRYPKTWNIVFPRTEAGYDEQIAKTSEDLAKAKNGTLVTAFFADTNEQMNAKHALRLQAELDELIADRNALLATSTTASSASATTTPSKGWFDWLLSLFGMSTDTSTPPKESYENYPFHSPSYDHVQSARFAPV